VAIFFTALPNHPVHAWPPAPLGPSRGIVIKLAALFSVDAFAGGLLVHTLLALWLFERFDLSLAAAGQFFFWAGPGRFRNSPPPGWRATSASSTRWCSPTSRRASA
jgi:hypothetical protein